MKKKKQRVKKKKSPEKKKSVNKSGRNVKTSVKASQDKVVKTATSQEAAKKPAVKKTEGGNSILAYVNKAGRFLREAKVELKKVKWPTRKELLASTAVVIVLTLLVAFFLGLVDFGLIKIIRITVG